MPGCPSALTQALKSVERGGTVLLFAAAEKDVTITIPVTELFYKNDITLTTSYAGSPADYATALKLIGSKRFKFNEMITHRLSLAETGLGFQLVAAAGESIKVIIEPQR